MHEVRGELRLGRVFEAETTYPHDPSPQEAKANIRRALGLGSTSQPGQVVRWISITSLSSLTASS